MYENMFIMSIEFQAKYSMFRNEIPCGRDQQHQLVHCTRSNFHMCVALHQYFCFYFLFFCYLMLDSHLFVVGSTHTQTPLVNTYWWYDITIEGLFPQNVYSQNVPKLHRVIRTMAMLCHESMKWQQVWIEKLLSFDFLTPLQSIRFHFRFQFRFTYENILRGRGFIIYIHTYLRSSMRAVVCSR